MRTAPILLMTFAMALSACAVLRPVADVATRPFGKKNAFEQIQSTYVSNIRFGLYADAVAQVEPELKARFKAEIPRYSDLRFSDAYTESIEIDALRTKARVVVVYRGYWLSSPFEREMRVVQQWRRAVPTQDWFVTPDFDGLLSPPDASGS